MPEQDSLRVTICSSFVVKPLNDYILYWSNEFELNIEVSFAPYNQVFQQLLNPSSQLNQNKGIKVLFIRVEDWLRDQKDKSPSEQADFLNETYLEFKEAITAVRKITNVPFLIGITPLSPSNSFSSRIQDLITDINSKLDSELKQLPSFHLIDLTKIAGLYDVEEMFDQKSDEIAHIPFTTDYYAALGTFLTRRVRSYKFPSYKVIAFDCDNTLWKGSCSVNGKDNVIDKNFRYLQEFLLEKYNEGFLLVLCTNNNEPDVWKVFDHNPAMKLRREHIAAYRMNEDPIPDNLISVATELNLGLDNFIYLNNIAGTGALSETSPEILSLTLPDDPESFFTFLNHTWEFDTFHATEEDRQRNKMYRAEKERKDELANFTHFNDFIESLNIKINLHSLEEKDLDRALQLTLRTNQFNLNGIRKTREEISEAIKEKNSFHWIIDVKDRFGDYGIVGFLLGSEITNTLLIDTFVLSCRALGKNVEQFILQQLQNYCTTKGLQVISATFQETPRNKPFLEFLQKTNWEPDTKTNRYNFLIKEESYTLIENEK